MPVPDRWSMPVVNPDGACSWSRQGAVDPGPPQQVGRPCAEWMQQEGSCLQGNSCPNLHLGRDGFGEVRPWFNPVKHFERCGREIAPQAVLAAAPDSPRESSLAVPVQTAPPTRAKDPSDAGPAGRGKSMWKGWGKPT
eukprot:TRINITY_DN24816_c0_g1_i1.p2 TRINITY_DN24816_c0_g1~~TRINITY_DN24816_c0_g1_i1.p2  ORF type:complete len:154 (+),score=19.12 TRINITY_DN24816_c0_g1_i1:50-463(+)